MLRPLAALPNRGLSLAPSIRGGRGAQNRAPIQCHISSRHASSLKEAATALPESSLGLDSLSNILRLPIEYMHDSLGIPWLWVIPLSAAAIRALLYYPITRATRKALQRRLAISPLVNAHKPWYLKEARKKARANPATRTFMRYSRSLRELTKELSARYACGLSRTMFLPILQFPVFLGMSWNLREMLGIPGGTLKSLFGTMLGREALSDAKAAQQAALSFEPTMMEEGLPWAIDLTVADPTGTLSYGVAVIMASQVLLGMRGQSGRISMLSRVLLLLSMSIGPLMASAPTGILYYWACSSGFALITNVFLDWKYPLVRFAPCKRPLLTSGLKPK